MAMKPRIAIVGAGMAGLSAANRLVEAMRTKSGPTPLEVVVVEANNRAGGRIHSTEFHGEKVELGATWIHGIEGSPIYAIAQQIGAMKAGGKPWEFMDFPLDIPVVAEGGLAVPPSVVDPMAQCYKQLLSIVQNQFKNGKFRLGNGELAKFEESARGCRSLEEYLRKGLQKYLEESANQSMAEFPSAVFGQLSVGESSLGTPKWDLRSLQEAAFWSYANLERHMTAADDLNNVDLESNKDYWEFPGVHKPLPKGFSSVVNELVRRLPEGTVVYNSRVESIVWGRGSRAVLLKGPEIEADHVILTVSLGVLKSCIKGCKKNDADAGEEGMSEGLGFHGFEPPLPSRKVGAISRLGFGVVDKVHMHFSSKMTGIRFLFEKEQDSDGGHGIVPWWMRKTFQLVPTHKNSRTVAAWLVGKEAIQMESLVDEKVIQGVLDTLSVFGKIPKKGSHTGDGHGALNEEESKPLVLENILRSNWGTNPLFRGSYSYVPVGSSGDDIETLSEPLPYLEEQSSSKPLQILFAGEATDRHYYSTTHAAYLSGVREANRLLKHYNLL